MSVILHYFSHHRFTVNYSLLDSNDYWKDTTMKKILGRLFIFITLLLLALLLTSCNFPFFPTAQPAAEPVEEPLGTPTPE